MSSSPGSSGGDKELIENVDAAPVVDPEENYKPPPEKSIEQILDADKEDESLRKYKEALLGEVTKEAIVVEPNDPRKVIVKKLVLVVADRDDVELDLTGDISKLKKQVIDHSHFFRSCNSVCFRLHVFFPLSTPPGVHYQRRRTIQNTH